MFSEVRGANCFRYRETWRNLTNSKLPGGVNCFRYWEIGSLGVKENILKVLPSSKTPKLPTAKAKRVMTKRIEFEVAI